MTDASSLSPRWLPAVIAGLHLALLGSVWGIIIGGLSSSLVTILLPTIIILKLAIAGVFGSHIRGLSLYEIPSLPTARPHTALLMAIFLCYMILVALTAINGVEWNGVASKVCAGIIVGGDLYLIVRGISHDAMTGRTKPSPGRTR